MMGIVARFVYLLVFQLRITMSYLQFQTLDEATAGQYALRAVVYKVHFHTIYCI